MKHKPTLLLFEEEYESKQSGIKAVYNVLVEEKGFEVDQVKQLVVNYPAIMSKSESELRDYFEVHGKYNINNRMAMDLLVQVPKLISQNLDQKFKDFIFLFNLYHKIEQKNFLKIYINFPYMMCQDTAKIQRFLGEFKKYKLTQ